MLRLIARDGERGVEAVAVALGELLSALRAHGPVLVTIDDADLLDDATMSTLSLICQRVGDGQLWLLTTRLTHRGTVASPLLSRSSWFAISFGTLNSRRSAHVGVREIRGTTVRC